MSATATVRARGLPRAVARLLVSEWVWVAALVAASVAIRFALARVTASPWIFVDELIYAEIAKSIAEDGERSVRDVPVGNAYGLLYPLLLSPAYVLFERVPDAYEAMKLVNAFVVSLVAVPVYLIGRRLLTPPFALLAAALALAPPALLYSGMLMTENAFYPAFALAALMLVRALERPTWTRAIALVGAIGVAFLVRVQAVALLPAALSAPVLLTLFEGRARALREQWRIYAAVGAAAVLAGLWYVAQGRSPREALGAYATVSSGRYDASEVARWVVYHVAELDLAVAVAPLAAFGLLLAVARSQAREVQIFLAAATSLFVWLLVQVSAFASLPYVQRVEERNLFHVMPLLFLALLVWVRVGAPRPRLRTAMVTAAVVLLPLALPWERLLAVQALSDTFSLLPWWDVYEAGVLIDRLGVLAAVVAAIVSAAFVTLPRRLAPLLAGLVLLYLAAEHESVYGRVEAASVGALFQGMGGQRPDWVDAEVSPDREVAVVWSARVDYRTVFLNEFFSRSVGPVYYLGSPTPGALPEAPVSVDGRDGRLLDAAGRPIAARYALTDRTVSLDGETLAQNVRPGSVLLRTDGFLRLSHTVDGVYPDGWSGPTVTYTRLRCRGGTAIATVQSDGGLFDRAQTVRASVAGRRALRFRVPAGATRRLTVPLTPRGSACAVTFTVSPTAVPARVDAGATDERELGMHFLAFDHRP